MTSRSSALLLLATFALLSVAPAATGGQPPVGSTLYLVRLDPRLCPSPLCGGLWVTRVNHVTTRCADGVLRARCYVARSENEDRPSEAALIPDGALVRADLEPWTFEGFGNLGSLVVAEVWGPAGRAPETGTYQRLVDLGIRCVRAPCFSLRATRVNGTARTGLSDVDLAGASASEAQIARARAALGSKRGLLARGRIVGTSAGGRVFRASRLFLRVPQPRA